MTQEDEIEKLKRIHKVAIDECKALLDKTISDYEIKLSASQRQLAHYKVAINRVLSTEDKHRLDRVLDTLYEGEDV